MLRPSIFAALLALLAVPASAGPVTLLSRADPAQPSDTAGGASAVAGISSDGRWVLYLSNADNLLPGVTDTNTGNDVFLHDRIGGTTVLVSHRAGDPTTTGDQEALGAALSADGRYAYFRSRATDLIAGQVDSFFSPDLFLYDRDTGGTTLISHPPGQPTVAAGVGWDGTWDRLAMSADGARVAYKSLASNLVVGQSDGQGTLDVFLWDRASGINSLISHTSGSATTAAGAWSVELSADGNWVTFSSSSPNVVAGQSDANGGADVFLHDRTTGATAMVSHIPGSATTAAGSPSGNPVVSADGERVAFLSLATNLVTGQADSNGDVDVFLYDRATGTNLLVSRSASSAVTTADAGGSYDFPAISTDGRFVAFESRASNLIPGDSSSRTDAFLFDRLAGTNVLVSRSSSSPGTPSNGESGNPQVSSDGSFVVFPSNGTNLVAGQTDTALSDDLFLWTRATGTVVLVSHEDGLPAVAGKGGSGGSSFQISSGSSFQISGDGSWIALVSRSESLVSGIDDLNGTDDVFLHERATDQSTLVTARGGPVSASAGGLITRDTVTSMSNDGRYIVFTSAAPNLAPGVTDRNNATDVFLHDRLTGTTTLVSHAASDLATTAGAQSYAPLVSTGGSIVLFESDAADLVPGQTAAATRQLYLWNRATGGITLVSHAASAPSTPSDGGIWGNGLYASSGDGRWIAFTDYGTNLVPGQSDFSNSDIFLYDRTTGGITLVSHASSSTTQAGNGYSSGPAISADGRYLVFHSDATNLVSGQSGKGIFLYDRLAGTTLLVSPSDDWVSAISADGRWVVYTSSANVFLWDRVTGSTQLVSHVPGSPTTGGNGLSNLGRIGPSAPIISADGRWVTFYSDATDLISGMTDGNGNHYGEGDVYLFDRISGTVTLVSRSAASPTSTGDRGATQPAISADGRFVVFLSQSANLVPGQLKRSPGYDVFLYGREAGTTALVSHIPTSDSTTGKAVTDVYFQAPRISADGAWVAFASIYEDLVSNDHDGVADAFLHANSLPGSDFYTVSPCRALDTRNGPALTSGVKRTVWIAGSCGIPATARAVALNVTVVQPTGTGELAVYPGDVEPTGTSTIPFLAGDIRANNAILGLAYGTGTLVINPTVTSNGTVHVIVDVSGYFQ